MFIQKGYVCFFTCSFYTVGPVLQLAPAHPRLLCTEHFSAAAGVRLPSLLSLYYQHLYATTVPSTAVVPSPFSFQLRFCSGEPGLRPTCSLILLVFIRSNVHGGVNTDAVRCDPRESFSIRSGFSDASLLDVRESVRLYRRFIFRFRDL